MKPSDAYNLICRVLKTGGSNSILLTGGPGVSKSALFAQACEELEIILNVSIPGLEDPTDPGGFPWISKDASHAKKVLFAQAYNAVNAKAPMLWLLEDLGQGMPATQAGYMQWIWARQVNGHKLPDYVTIGAATNRRTDRAGVTGMLEPVKSRFTTIISVEPDLRDLCNYAIKKLWSPEIVAYLRFCPEDIYQFNPTADMTNSPSPRTWENTNKLLQLQLPDNLEFPAIAGAIGEGYAAKFIAYLRTWRAMPNLDAILLNPDQVPIPHQLSALYAVATGLASKATPRNFDRVAKYAMRMQEPQPNHGCAGVERYDEATKSFVFDRQGGECPGHGDMSVFCVRDSLRRSPGVANTRAFQELASSPVGYLFTGQEG